MRDDICIVCTASRRDLPIPEGEHNDGCAPGDHTRPQPGDTGRARQADAGSGARGHRLQVHQRYRTKLDCISLG